MQPDSLLPAALKSGFTSASKTAGGFPGASLGLAVASLASNSNAPVLVLCADGFECRSLCASPFSPAVPRVEGFCGPD
ncbi:MAG: hypothetical protein ACI4NA_04120, partial [Succinivibrio sp.]